MRRGLAGLAGLAALLAMVAMLVTTRGSSIAGEKKQVALDQQEIGGWYGDGGDGGKEEEEVDKEYESAMPFRDPGHISRRGIFLSHAIRRYDNAPRNRGWDWHQPLWGKYVQAQQDPSKVSVGWTSDRKYSKDADDLQHVMERHAYGFEGHREPHETWSISDEDVDQQKEGLQTRAKRSGELKDKEKSLLKGQVTELRKELRNERKEIESLHDDVHELVSDERVKKDKKLRESLTYQVMKEKILNARKREQEAEQTRDSVGREEKEEKQQEADRESKLEAQIQKLQSRLRSKSPRRFSSSEAQRDLQSYFSKLDKDEAREEASHAEEKLEKLKAKIGRERRRRAASVDGQVELKSSSRRNRSEKLAMVPSRPAAHKDDLEALVQELEQKPVAPFLP